MSKLDRLRLEGGVLLTTGAIILIMTLGPVWSEITRLKDDTSTAQDLIVRHLATLSRETPANPYEGYEVYIASLEDGEDLNALSAGLQTSLIEGFRQNRVRLIDLRQIENETSISGLIGLGFTLNLEGDLQAVLDVISNLSTSSRPLLIEDLELKTRGPQQRPDNRIRASMTLRVWLKENA